MNEWPGAFLGATGPMYVRGDACGVTLSDGVFCANEGASCFHRLNEEGLDSEWMDDRTALPLSARCDGCGHLAVNHDNRFCAECSSSGETCSEVSRG